MTKPTTIRDALENFCTASPQAEYSSQELINGVLERLDVQRDSVMPYDYCYNHENKGSSEHKLFERVGRGRFRRVHADPPVAAASVAPLNGSPNAVRLTEALDAREVNLAVGEHLGPEYSYGSLPLALSDAIFSLALRYDAQCVPVVHAFAEWLGLPLGRGGASMTCTEALARLDTLDGDRVVEAFGGKRYRTSTQNGILKAEAVRRALRLLVQHGINDFADMRHDNPALPLVERAFARLPGQSRLTAWKYFVMLAGDEQGVKPDRHLLRFVTTALGRASITDDACVRIVQESAQLLQEDHPWMTPRRLDYSIWAFERT